MSPRAKLVRPARRALLSPEQNRDQEGGWERDRIQNVDDFYPEGAAVSSTMSFKKRERPPATANADAATQHHRPRAELLGGGRRKAAVAAPEGDGVVLWATWRPPGAMAVGGGQCGRDEIRGDDDLRPAQTMCVQGEKTAQRVRLGVKKSRWRQRRRRHLALRGPGGPPTAAPLRRPPQRWNLAAAAVTQGPAQEPEEEKKFHCWAHQLVR